MLLADVVCRVFFYDMVSLNVGQPNGFAAATAAANASVKSGLKYTEVFRTSSHGVYMVFGGIR